MVGGWWGGMWVPESAVVKVHHEPWKIVPVPGPGWGYYRYVPHTHMTSGRGVVL
jgi:hypothetical protein